MQDNNYIFKKLFSVRIFIPVIVALCFLNSCASTYAPSDWLKDPEEAAQTGYGGWADITFKNDSMAVGELIAVYPDTLLILTNLKLTKSDSIRPRSRLAAIAKNKVSEVMVTYYDSEEGAVAIATLVGMLSAPPLHGGFTIFTGPMWLLGGTAAAAARSYAPVIDYPESKWMELVMYARFPQGIPETVHRDSILAKPYLRE